LVLMLETLNVAPEIQPQADIFIVSVGEKADIAALQIAEQLRDAMPSVKVLINCGGGSFKSQFKKADKSGASLAVVLGEDELQGGEAAVKPLRAGQGEQQLVALAELVNHISKNHF
jgi:histidyl-tRNA synthetase